MKSTNVYFFVLLIFIAGLFISTEVKSQSIPSFNILQSNGKVINSSKLIDNRPIVLIYFSPDCDHCTLLLNSLFKQIDQFKKARIILVSFRPLSEITAFEKSYKTAQYKNMLVGMEQPIFFLKNYYNLESTPFTALFGRKGNLIYSYKKETPLNDLIMRLKKIR